LCEIRIGVKITEARIRQIVQEELQSYGRVAPAIKSVMSYAETFVESVLDGGRDAVAATGLSEATMDLKILNDLLYKNHAPEAPNLAVLVRLAKELSEKSGFWKTPTLIGKREHQKFLATQLARMKKVAKTVMASISADRQAA
jgi:hypothetical protein